MSEVGQSAETVQCPTCTETTLEQHPRQPHVMRCVNCKEWLRVDRAEHDQRYDFVGAACPDCKEPLVKPSTENGAPFHHFECVRGHMFTIGELQRTFSPAQPGTTP